MKTPDQKRDLSIRPRAENAALVAERLSVLDDLNKLHRNPDSPKVKRTLEVANARRKALREVERDIKSNSVAAPILFLSYSGLGEPLAKRAREMAGEYGFRVKTGFDVEVDVGVSEDGATELSLPQAIISQIVSSTCFLGIWTEDFVGASNRPGRDGRGTSIEKQEGSVPSVWLPFELGIAASHGLPFRLLVSEGMHRLYYEKPFSFKTQIVYSTANFIDKLQAVMKYFEKRMLSIAWAGGEIYPRLDRSQR